MKEPTRHTGSTVGTIQHCYDIEKSIGTDDRTDFATVSTLVLPAKHVSTAFDTEGISNNGRSVAFTRTVENCGFISLHT